MPASTHASRSPRRFRCRCGHLLTNHLQVEGIPGSASFRLEPTGPCALCGEGICRKFSPGTA